MRQSGDMEFRLADIFTDANILKSVSEEADHPSLKDAGIKRGGSSGIKKASAEYT